MERPQITGQNSVKTPLFNKKVLIIEPDESMKLLLDTIFKIQGYDAEVIYDAGMITNYNTPAVIVLDAGNVDNLAGIDICKKLKKLDNYKNTKFIMTSIIHDKELILDSGADLYIPKPYDISTLVKWVDTFIKEVNTTV